MKNFLSGSTRSDSDLYKIRSGGYVVYENKESGSFTIDIGDLSGIGVTFIQAVKDLTDKIKEEDAAPNN